MKGVVFNLLEEVVDEEYGEGVWDDLLDDVGLEGAYTSLGSYDDAELGSLVAAAAVRLSLSPEEVSRWFGHRAIARMYKRWPGYFDAHRQTFPFLRSLNSVIHPEVHKLYPGADCPYFDFSSPSERSLLIGYQSPRKLCALAHGFILGSADHYGEALTVRHRECMKHNAARCVLEVSAV